MENLISTIQKELDSNSLYLNHCNSEIQLLRSINGICCDGNDLTPILKLKPVESLKRILSELRTKKEEQAQRKSKEFEILTDQIAQKVEFNPDFEKANLQLLSDFNARLSGKDLEDKNDRI